MVKQTKIPSKVIDLNNHHSATISEQTDDEADYLTSLEQSVVNADGLRVCPVQELKNDVSRGFPLKVKIRRFFFKLLLDARARRLSPHVMNSTKNCRSLLDPGCGDMIFTEFIHSTSGLKVNGVDMIDSNLSHLPVRLYNGDVLPFHDKTFDAAMVAYVLHHCHDIAAVLREMMRVTTRKLIVFEEVYKRSTSRCVLNLHDFGNRFLSSKMNIPYNFLRIEEWYELFGELGLNVVNCTRVYQYPVLNMTHQVLFELQIE